MSSRTACSKSGKGRKSMSLVLSSARASGLQRKKHGKKDKIVNHARFAFFFFPRRLSIICGDGENNVLEILLDDSVSVLIAESKHATSRVLDQDELLGPEQLLGNDDAPESIGGASSSLETQELGG